MQNTYIPKFTYIIPFRYRQDRIIPLRRIIDWLSGFQGVEIIIVEQDKHSKISNLSLRANHIFIESNLPFNKSWAFNVGLKRSKSPIVICADADFIMNPNDMIECLRVLDSCECVIPTSNIVGLTPQESVGDVNNILSIKRDGVKSNMTNGMVIFKKDALYKIGGWNEDFLGNGFENKFQDKKIVDLLSYRQLDFTGYHFYHNTDQFDFNLQQRNQQIMDFYKDSDVSKLNQHVQMTIGRIGSINKYQSI